MSVQFHNEPSGMQEMTDQVIATDYLISSKSAIRSYAWALSEVASPKVREIQKGQFDVAVNNHTTITRYMIKKGYYEAYDPQKQYALDMQTADKVMDLPK